MNREVTVRGWQVRLCNIYIFAFLVYNLGSSSICKSYKMQCQNENVSFYERKECKLYPESVSGSTNSGIITVLTSYIPIFPYSLGTWTRLQE